MSWSLFSFWHAASLQSFSPDSTNATLFSSPFVQSDKTRSPFDSVRYSLALYASQSLINFFLLLHSCWIMLMNGYAVMPISNTLRDQKILTKCWTNMVRVSKILPKYRKRAFPPTHTDGGWEVKFYSSRILPPPICRHQFKAVRSMTTWL